MNILYRNLSRLTFTVGVLLTSTAALATGSSEKIAQHLAESVRFKTISHQNLADVDPKPFEQHKQFLQDTYPEVFSQLEVQWVNEYSLLIRWPGSDSSLNPVLFLAHTDVVPIEPGTESEWTHPPFAGVIQDGIVWGRGTLDDKVGVIGLLEATTALLNDNHKPKRDVYFAFGHDEEVGGPYGATAMAEIFKQRGLAFEFILDEGGAVVAENPILPGKKLATVNVSEKTYTTLTLTSRGQGGHSSTPPKHTAIGILAEALAKIEANPMPARITLPVQGMLEALSPHMSGIQSFVFNNLWLTEPLVIYEMDKTPLTGAFIRSTSAVTMFNGGVKENVVPQIATAKVNFRLLPGDTKEDAIAHVRAVIQNDEIEITTSDWAIKSKVASTDNLGFRSITKSVEAVYPDAVVAPSLMFGATDSRMYNQLSDNIYRFHGMEITMQQTGTIHGTDEHISIESMASMVEIAKQIIVNSTL
jgi:carboxypeptidase PM20D1